MEPNLWADFFKGAAQLGLAGLFMGYAVFWLNKKNSSIETKAEVTAKEAALKSEEERKELAAKVEDERKARIAALEQQNTLCQSDRVELHKQQNLDRANFNKEISDLRTTYESRIDSLNSRILDIYKTRTQTQIADRMEKAANVMKEKTNGGEETKAA